MTKEHERTEDIKMTIDKALSRAFIAGIIFGGCFVASLVYGW